MNKKNYCNFCIVGLGNHGLNKLIPAINLSKGHLSSVVTQKKINLGNIKTFKYLKSALNNLDKKTIIVLCTPPEIRANQIILCIKNSFSVISEKPIFLNANKLDKAYLLLKGKNLFLFENYMYLYSSSFKKFYSIFKKNKKKIKKIKIDFIIPNFPNDSFRVNKSSNENIIFDIACYPISLINYLKLKIINIETKLLSQPKKHYKIFVNTENFIFDLTIGLGLRYKNNLSIYLNSSEYNLIKLNYFFYGIEKIKKISYIKNRKKIYEENFLDLNSFTKIFNFSNDEFHKTKNTYNYSKKNLDMLLKIFNLINSSH